MVTNYAALAYKIRIKRKYAAKGIKLIVHPPRTESSKSQIAKQLRRVVSRTYSALIIWVTKRKDRV